MDRLTALAESFAAGLKPEDRERFESTSFDDMQIAIGEIQSAQVRHKVMMNMNRLRMFLSGMEEFRDTLAAINSRDADQELSFVWGSLRFLLEKTHKTDRAFDKVLDVYERLGTDLPRVSQYKEVFLEYPDSQECLANVYEDIQRFHSLAYELFTLRPKLWQRLYKHVWKDLSTTFKQLVKSLRAHSAFLDSCKATSWVTHPGPDESSDLGLARYRCRLREGWEKFADEEEARKREQRRRVNAWISSSNKNEEMQKKFRGMRACADSGRWIFRKYSRVTEWMREEDAPEPAIWLHGSKGFGKTMLASLVVDELNALADRNRLIPADSKTYHFFCQEEDEEHSTHLGVLNGLLSQMVAADPYILPLCEDKMVNGGGGDTLAHAETAQGLVEAFVEHSPRQYVVLDGLDECDVTEARQTAEFFKGLVRKYNREVSGQVAGGDGDTEQGRLRVLYTSQPMPELSSRMPKDNASIALKAMDNADDIRKYVRSRIPEFSESGDTQSGFNLSEEDEEQIVSIICQQSEDMFLHAHLTVEYLLQQQTKGDLLEKIKQEMLPEGLSEIYEKLLGSVKERLSGPANEGQGQSRWDMAKLLLGWLVCAKRPLKWHEMQAILAFDPESGTVDFDNKMLRHNVRKYLGSLVHVLDGGHIKLIHSTARWHIVHNKHINEEEVQCKLAALCLQYLSLPCFTEDHTEAQRKEDARRGWFSFQDYACSQWHSHVDTVIRGSNDIPHTDAALSDFSSALQTFIDAHGHDLTTDLHPELAQDHLSKFLPLPLHANLLTLWNHIYTHQKSPPKTRNTIGIPQLSAALDANRAALETHFTPSSPAVHSDTIQDYYGPNLFKCHRTLCRLFYAGHPTRRARDEHDGRHDRPHPCPESCKSAPIGFSTAKDRDRHVRIYHPERGEGLSRFEALTRRQAAGKFACRTCGATFTRKINLQGHERSHYGDRPYACSACGKAFARVNDCRRHEKRHVARRRAA